MSINGSSNIARWLAQHKWIAALLCAAAASLGSTLQAAGQPQPADASAAPEASRPSMIREGLGADGKLDLMVSRSAVVTTRTPYKRVSVGQPEIADVNAIAPRSVLVTARKPGTTQLILWDDEDHSQIVDVIVRTDLHALQEQLRSMFPGSSIVVSGLNGAVALRGSVPTLEVAQQAVEVASPYAPRVLNFLEIAGGRQVMLQVRFAEVSRSAIRNLGVNFGFTDGVSFAGSNIGNLSPLGIVDNAGGASLAVRDPSPAVTVFGRGEVGNTAFAYFVEALRQNNLLRVLAEPNLIAISGQEASFLAGGDFPVPVVQGGGGTGGTAVTVEYRDFGVKLNFVPIVLGNGRIRLKMSPEVSDVDFSNAVRANGFLIPGRRTRKLTTTVELVDGQSFAVAGLLDNRVVATKDVTPGLGDLPVLGALFRSTRYQRNETELVVLVTPRLVEPLNPEQVPPLPGQSWRYPTESELFWKQDLGGPANQGAADGSGATTRPTTAPMAAAARSQSQPAPQFRGQYGFVPAAVQPPAGAVASASATDDSDK